MKKFLVLVLAAAMALSLVACGGNGGNASAGDGTSLTIAIDADYQTLHPANWTTNIEHRIDSQIYDTLVRYNFQDESKLDGVIAESWEISDDACCYTFHLREGIPQRHAADRQGCGVQSGSVRRLRGTVRRCGRL